MRNLIAYIRKNAIFVVLLTVLVACCIGFGGYILTQNSNTPIEPAPPIQEEPSDNTAKITSFEGTYGRDATVHLSWSIQSGGQEIKSVKLFYEGRQLGGEMKDLTAFTMAQNIYQFPTGDCTFTLQAILADGTELTKDVTVFISYVMGINMTTEVIEDGMLLKLAYSYDQNNPVSVPRIKFITGSNIPFELSYQETTKEESGSMIQAVTIFKLSTEKLNPGSYDMTVRWIFDGLNISKDYTIKVTK